MNLIARLFGLKSPQSLALNNSDVATDVAAPSKDLFTDSTPPAVYEETAERGNALSDFLAMDFSGSGARDGFNFHSAELMEARKKEIKSTFLHILDQVIWEKKSKHVELQHMVIDLREISPELKAKFEESIEEVDDAIDTLVLQKELTSLDEGLIMGPIRKYHTGFLQGMKDYVDTEKFLGSSSIFKS